MKTNMTGRVGGMAAWVAAIALLATLSGGVHAQTANHGSSVQASEIGHSTRAWLDLQRSNEAAAPALPMLGSEGGLAYQRYMESFKTKIPSSFGSSLSDNGNQLHVDYTHSNGSQQN